MGERKGTSQREREGGVINHENSEFFFGGREGEKGDRGDERERKWNRMKK